MIATTKAQTLAALLNTELLAERKDENGNTIIVLVSGPKLTYSEAELDQHIAELQEARSPKPKQAAAPDKKKKGK